MKYSKYVFLLLVIALSISMSGLIFYDAALKVQEKSIEIINFDTNNTSLNVSVENQGYTLLKFEVLKLDYAKIDDLVIKVGDKEVKLENFDLKHEKIFLTQSALEICYVQSELKKSSNKFEEIKNLVSTNNLVRVKDKDYHVKTLADLSKGGLYNYKYILPVECSLSDEEKLIEINQYINYSPREQRKLLESKLKEIETTNDINKLNEISAE